MVDSGQLNVSTSVNGYSTVTWVTNVFLQGGLLTILRPSIVSISCSDFLISLEDLVRVIGGWV